MNASDRTSRPIGPSKKYLLILGISLALGVAAAMAALSNPPEPEIMAPGKNYYYEQPQEKHL